MTELDAFFAKLDKKKKQQQPKTLAAEAVLAESTAPAQVRRP